MNAQLNRRHFMGGAIAVMAAAFVAPAAKAQTKKRNIVFVLTDDQRYDAMGITGHPFLETPHLDRLAKNGILCENAFVTTSLCSPSRASILTGQYAHRHGVMDNGTLLDPNTATFPQELQKAGYRTGFVGKWHMGGSSDDPRPGFDRWVSFRGQGRYYNQPFNVDGEKVPQEGHTSDRITDYGVEFIEQADDQPFCLYLSHKAVHQEFAPAERHKGSYADESWPLPDSYVDTDENYEGKPDWVRNQRPSWHGVDGYGNATLDVDTFTRDYAECMRSVDDSVGRLMKALDDKGLLESTFFVFTSDNGFLFGEHGLVDKRCMYEESIRVPLIVHCPELYKGGQTTDEIFTNIDFAPTFCELAGVTPPTSMQGASMLSPLAGDTEGWREEFLYEYFWERSFPQTPTVLGVRTKTHKLMVYHGIYDRYELYDLKNDPKEMNNLLGEYRQTHHAGWLDGYIRKNAPEDTKALFNDLRGRLDTLCAQYGARLEPTWAK